MGTSKLALGSVQFGMPYGVSNRTGIPDDDSLQSILNLANKSGISLIDTAQAYGDSEQRLGQHQIIASFDIVSKVGPGTSAGNLAKSVQKSCETLNIPGLYGMLLHRFGDLQENQGLHSALLECKEEGLVHKIGYSLYSPEELAWLANNQLSFDLLQVPYNLYDRRFESHFEELADQGVEIHIRSAFLQGLFFLEYLEGNLARFQSHHDLFLKHLAENELSPLEACLGFVVKNPFIDKVVVGVNAAHELQEIINCCEQINLEEAYLNAPELASEDEQLLIPSNW